MIYVRICSIMAATLSLAGCVFGYHTAYSPALDVDKALFFSPRGEFEFEADERVPSKLHANDGTTVIWIAPFPLHDYGRLDVQSVDARFGNAYYQLNGGEKQKLQIEPRHLSADFKITAPATMNIFSYSGRELRVVEQGKGKELQK